MIKRHVSIVLSIHRFVARTSKIKFVLTVLTIAFVFRVAAIIVMGNFQSPYLYEYGMIARNMIAGHGYSLYYQPLEQNPDAGDYVFTIPPPPTAFTLPGIVVVYYVVLSLFDETLLSIILFYLLNLCTALISLVGIYFLTGKMFEELVARWALILASVYPVFVYAVTTFGGAVYYHAVAVVGLLSIYELLRRRTLLASIVAGIMSGVWMYFRPEMAFLSFFIALFLWKKVGRRFAMMYFFLVVLCAIPWTLRNYLVYDAFIPLTTNSWLNVWRGNNLETTGGSWNHTQRGNWYDENILRQLKSIPQTKHMEIDISHVYRDAALRYLKEHPAHAVGLFLKKYLMFWTFDFSDPRAKNVLYLASHGLFLLIFIAGFISLLRARQFPVLLLIFIGTYSVIVSLLHVESRYQTYVSLFYIPVAASFVTQLMKKKHYHLP